MLRTRTTMITSLAALALAGASGCGAEPGNDTMSAETAIIGDALPGTDPVEFAETLATFSAVEELEDGVGPIFNEKGCAICHSLGATGGAGEQIERRFGRFVNGRFDPMSGSGGSLRQLFTVGTFKNGDTECTVPLEVEPAGATVHNVGRLTTPLFGLGLVDAMPDSFFDRLAASQPSSVRGIVNRVRIVLPNTEDPSQSVGSVRVGRFGWKGGVANLVQFAADAYVNEMGITTQSCVNGISIVDFATESAPNGVPQALGCDDLAPPAPDGAPPGTDDAVGSCAGGLTEIQDDVAEFAEFMTHLAPPPRVLRDRRAIDRGNALLDRVGCSSCHVSQTFRTPRSTPNGAPGNFPFSPYSDFLIHDMGSLGDQIGNAGDSFVATRRMRTAPLWGIRFRTHLLHDGRATDIASAIRAHDGQAAASRNAFNALRGFDQRALVEFVRAL